MEFTYGKQNHFFQFFVPLRPDGTKRYQIHIPGSISSLDSKLELGDPHN
jgi:hypothetical protein